MDDEELVVELGSSLEVLETTVGLATDVDVVWSSVLDEGSVLDEDSVLVVGAAYSEVELVNVVGATYSEVVLVAVEDGLKEMVEIVYSFVVLVVVDALDDKATLALLITTPVSAETLLSEKVSVKVPSTLTVNKIVVNTTSVTLALWECED